MDSLPRQLRARRRALAGASSAAASSVAAAGPWVAAAVLCCAAAGLWGCERDQAGDAPGAGASASAPGDPPPPKLAAAKLASPLDWTRRPSGRGLGLPQGCLAELPIRRAALPESPAAFVSARGAAPALALAIAPSAASTAVARRGLVPLEGGSKVVDLPWSELYAPPLLDHAKGGWVGAFDLEASSGNRHALLWREGKEPERLGFGDQLFVADTACGAKHCAVLSSRPLPSSEAGATLYVGEPGSPASSWKRHAITADQAPGARPLSVVEVRDEASVDFTLEREGELELWELRGAKAKRSARLPLPHGALEVIPGPRPLVVSPGASLDEPCKVDAFDIVVQPFGGEASKVHTRAPPQGAIGRALEHGAILAWVAPASCRVGGPALVHAVLLRPDGSPASSPMGVTVADGFAMATHGDRVDLWLARDGELTWLRARCRPRPPPEEPSKPAASAQPPG